MILTERDYGKLLIASRLSKALSSSSFVPNGQIGIVLAPEGEAEQCGPQATRFILRLKKDSADTDLAKLLV